MKTRTQRLIACFALLLTVGCSNEASLKTLFGGSVLTEGVDLVPLGGEFAGPLPEDSSWSCAHEGGVTMHVHTNSEGVVDVLVVAENSHPLLLTGKKMVAIERELDVIHMVKTNLQPNFVQELGECVRRYEALHAAREQGASAPSSVGVDPYAGLIGGSPAEPVDSGSPANLPTSEAELELPPKDKLTSYCVSELNGGLSTLEAGVEMLRLAVGMRTLGQGLGFSPAPEGFRGWKWVGRFNPVKTVDGRSNAAVDYRIGARDGSWQLPSVEGLEDSPHVSALHVIANLAPVHADGHRGATSTYVTVLCQKRGETCVQQDALLTMFSGIQTNYDARAVQRECTGDSIEAFAKNYGLDLLGDRSVKSHWKKF